MARSFRSLIRAALKGRNAETAPSAPMSHVEKNRRYWDIYAEGWSDEFRGYEIGEGTHEPERYAHLGDEWGNPKHLQEVLDQFVFPYLSEQTIALEIGTGGGRVAAQVARRVKHLYCADISAEMLKRLAKALGNRDNVSLILVEGATLPPSLSQASIDFVYSFDVLVHLDLHTIWKYVRQIGELLKPGGLAFLHTTNLSADGGWERFAAQESYSLEGHYFITPEIVKLLAHKAGLHIELEGAEDPANFYKARDYLVLLRK